MKIQSHQQLLSLTFDFKVFGSECTFTFHAPVTESSLQQSRHWCLYKFDVNS